MRSQVTIDCNAASLPTVSNADWPIPATKNGYTTGYTCVSGYQPTGGCNPNPPGPLGGNIVYADCSSSVWSTDLSSCSCTRMLLPQLPWSWSQIHTCKYLSTSCFYAYEFSIIACTNTIIILTQTEITNFCGGGVPGITGATNAPGNVAINTISSYTCTADYISSGGATAPYIQCFPVGTATPTLNGRMSLTTGVWSPSTSPVTFQCIRTPPSYCSAHTLLVMGTEYKEVPSSF